MKTPYNIQIKRILQKLWPDVKWEKDDIVDIYNGDNFITVEKTVRGFGKSTDFSFKLEEFPGCCGIVIMYDTDDLNYISIELLPIAIKLAMKAAYNDGYRQLMLADIYKPLWEAAESLGFTKTSEFTNSRTQNKIRSYTKTLTQDTTPLM